MSDELLIIGISGVTCGGKTTVATELTKLLPNSTLISQDDYFLAVDDPRHTWIPELNHINYDILSSLDMEQMHQDILDLISNKTLISSSSSSQKTFRNFQDESNLKKLVYETIRSRTNLQILIIEGFTIFNYKPLRPLFHLKYYFMLSIEECRKRRSQRVYEPPDCPGYFEMCVWPEHIKQLEEVKREVDNVRFFNEHTKSPLEKILEDIINSIS